MLEAPFDPVKLAIPFFILAIVLEIALGRLHVAKAEYEARDTLASLGMGLLRGIPLLLTAGIAFGAMVWVWEHRIFTIPFTAWWGWVAIFFLEDLVYYAFHRISHERRFWWAAHVNHHSSQHYNLSTALRQTWTGGITGTWALWLPLAFLGFSPAQIAIQQGISLVYQFWIHTEAVGRMPAWFEAVFNTPSHHRVHHARNPRYLDRNYAGILIIWDKMFGSFVAERDDEPVRYGIVKQLGSFNILWAAVHEWVGIAKDVWRAPWRHKLSYLLREPGWTHDGSRETSDMIRAKWQARVSTAAPPPVSVADRNAIARTQEAA